MTDRILGSPRALSIKSPIQKSALQISGLSPREVVMAAMKKVENSDVGDYKVPSTCQAITAGNYTVSKTKKVSILEEEANRKQNMPSPLNYEIKPATNWGEGKIAISKGKRMSEIDMIFKRNSKKETCTPSPQVYSP